MPDANTCIFLIKRNPEAVPGRLEKCQRGEVGVSSITFAALHYAVEKSTQIQRNGSALHGFKLPLEIAPFDEPAAGSYGAVRAALESAGAPTGAMDMLTGAHTLSLGVTLITNNTREFSRIKRLKTADWTR